ncbi:MAG TPA: serine hydroxymethyltransferase, partial [Aggregatilineales bacterium]|nr:serine hydroxymethyltransferase [Aggregatilineales bacterium]
TGGTDNHLLLVDLQPLNVTGDVAEVALDEAGITVNKNMIPYDPQPPKVTSGIRVGAPALTSRGFGTDEMRRVGELIGRVLHAPEDESVLAAVRAEVEELTAGFPVPGITGEMQPLPG